MHPEHCDQAPSARTLMSSLTQPATSGEELQLASATSDVRFIGMLFEQPNSGDDLMHELTARFANDPDALLRAQTCPRSPLRQERCGEGIVGSPGGAC